MLVHLDVVLQFAIIRDVLHICDALEQIHAVVLVVRAERGHRNAREELQNGATSDDGACGRLVRVNLAQVPVATTVTRQKMLLTVRSDHIQLLTALVLMRVAVLHFLRRLQSLFRSRAHFRAQVEHFAY